MNLYSIRSIPLEQVLSHYGVELIGSGIQLKAECPLPSHKSKEHPNTLAVNLEKQKFMCHSTHCNAKGDAVDFVRSMEGLDFAGACKRLRELFPQPSPVKHEPKPETNKPLGFRLKDVNPEHPMIQSRGISVETAAKYGIGYFPGAGSMKGRIVFELREAGEVVGYAGRLVNGVVIDGQPKEPKWLLPKGLVKFCYGLEFCSPGKLLIVGESFWLPPWLHEKGWQACSLMGHELTPRMEKELEPYRELVVAMDSDSVGWEAREKLAARLKANGHKVIKSSLLE